ncbi:hypothetical protein COOONC_18011 [Cooperia oncophora]
MAQYCANNRDVVCYLVTKHSWKGKYKRIFSIGTLAITTYNPQTLENTNQWQYEDFLAIKPSPKNNDSKQDEFVIHVRHKDRGKKDTMRFSSDYTAQILTDCLQFNSKFSERSMEPIVSCYILTFTVLFFIFCDCTIYFHFLLFPLLSPLGS